MKLFMVLLGCRIKGRNTEQHDIFFGIADNMKELIPEFATFWPEAKGKLHIDAWREVTNLNGNRITIVDRNELENSDEQSLKLYFINLGGYKPNEFDEYHYKIISVNKSISEAISEAKQTSFYKHSGFKGAESHVDDKYGIDVDDVFEIKDILSNEFKTIYAIKIEPSLHLFEPDNLNIGYFRLDKF
jgi:hypothetical protein